MGLLDAATGAIGGAVSGLLGGGGGGGGSAADANFEKAIAALDENNVRATERSIEVTIKQTDGKTAVDAGKAGRVA